MHLTQLAYEGRLTPNHLAVRECTDIEVTAASHILTATAIMCRWRRIGTKWSLVHTRVAHRTSATIRD